MMPDEEMRVQYIGRTPSSDVSIFSWILAAFFFNNILFYSLPSVITPLKKSYIVSIIHACISVMGVGLFYLRSTINLKQVNRILGGGVPGENAEAMAYSLCYTCGYLLNDTIIMLLYKSVRTRSALIHHVIVTTAFVVGLYTGIGHSCHFLLLAEELSTIPLNLKAIWGKNACLYNLFSGLFIVSFIFSRLIYGTVICWYTFRAVPSFSQMALRANDSWSVMFICIQVALCLSTRILNVYWTILLGRKIVSELRGNKRSVTVQHHEFDKKTQ